jgi:hypothetical protein
MDRKKEAREGGRGGRGGDGRGREGMWIIRGWGEYQGAVDDGWRKRVENVEKLREDVREGWGGWRGREKR